MKIIIRIILSGVLLSIVILIPYYVGLLFTSITYPLPGIFNIWAAGAMVSVFVSILLFCVFLFIRWIITGDFDIF
jgi:hypothetical protein